MRREVLTLLLAGVWALAADTVHAADQLIEKLITFKVIATFESVDLANNDFYFRFSEPMFATQTDPVSGHIPSTHGPQLGTFDNALVRFYIDLKRHQRW